MPFKRAIHPLRLLVTGVFLLLSACGGDSPDETSPTLTLDAEPSAFTLQQDLTLSGTAEAGAEVRLEREPDGAIVPAGVGPVWEGTISLVDGANVVTVTATDDAGNTYVIRKGIVFASYIAGHMPEAKDEVASPSTIEVTFTEDVQAESVKITVTGVDGVVTPAEGVARVFSWSPTGTPLQAGQEYTVTVSPVTTAAGRTYSAAYQWTFKTLPGTP